MSCVRIPLAPALESNKTGFLITYLTSNGSTKGASNRYVAVGLTLAFKVFCFTSLYVLAGHINFLEKSTNPGWVNACVFVRG